MEGDLLDHEFLDLFTDGLNDGEDDEWLPLAIAADERPYIKAETTEYFMEDQLTQLFTSHQPQTTTNVTSSSAVIKNGPQILCKKMVVDDPTLSHGQKLVRNGLTAFTAWTDFDADENSDDEDGEEGEQTIINGKKRRRTAKQKPINPDADLIAAATEENFKLLNLDPESKEGKRQRRRIRNRLSAQFHRERKKNYIAHMESLIKERDLKLQEIAVIIDTLTTENETLKMQVEKSLTMGGRNDSVANFSHVSSGFGSNTTHASLSDDVTDDSSSMGLSTAPSSPSSAAFTGASSPRTSFSRSSSVAVRSGVSLLSVFFMLGITLFGPPNTQHDHLNGNNNQMTVTTPTTMGKDASFFETPLQLLQLPQPQDNEPSSLSSSSLSSSSLSSALVHKRVILSTQQPQQQEEDQEHQKPPQIIISPLSSKPSLFINTPPAFGATSGAMWKYQSHVADLYPSLARYQSPDTFTTTSHDNDFTEGRNGNNTHNPKRRYLRSRSDQQSPSSVNITRISTVVNRRTIISPQQKEMKDEEEKGESVETMSLVPVSALPSPSNTATTGALLATSTLGESSPSVVSSMSRVLLTSGRALLDPAMVIRTGSTTTASKSTSDMTSDHQTETALSTWIDRAVGGIGIGARTTNTGNTVNSPPVVSVGVASAGVAGVTNSGNMLVMLLPASSVRWGKVWADSSEGTMEALLSGMNVDDKTTNSTTNENDQEGMWVEIGCSVFKAQLVRNVSLSA